VGVLDKIREAFCVCKQAAYAAFMISSVPY